LAAAWLHAVSSSGIINAAATAVAFRCVIDSGVTNLRPEYGNGTVTIA